jgi:hypothetical protein
MADAQKNVREREKAMFKTNQGLPKPLPRGGKSSDKPPLRLYTGKIT